MTVAEDLALRETTLKDLPSKFQVYDIDELKIRPFTASEVRNLSTVLKGQGGALRDELKDIVNETVSIDAATLTRGDFWFILAWLRINTFRNAPLNYSWQCPNGHENVTALVLTEMKLVELDQKFREPAYLTLGSGEEIPLQLPRLGDEAATVRYLKAMVPSGQWTKTEQTFVETACSIASGQTLQSRVDLLKSIEETPSGAEDLFMIENFHLSFQHGLPTLLSTACESCEYETEVPLPFTFQDILPYSSYREYIRNSIRFVKTPTGTDDE